MTNSKSYNINYNNSPPTVQTAERRSLALAALQVQNPQEKVPLAQHLIAQAAILSIADSSVE